MAIGVKKYNPGFLTDDEIVASFCVRTREFEVLLECLRESTGRSNAHALVIGPRGSGKTHLLLRVAAEMRRDALLAGFYPIVFAEESYEISTIGEFWLECLGRLAEQAPDNERADLRLSYDDLRSTGDDRDLADRCLGSVLDFADRHEKRVVMVVENLNMLFSDMVDPDAGWRLRHTLQTEPRIVLLGSATSRFDEIDHPDHALYDLLRVITLRPLDTEDCTALWQAVSGEVLRSRKGEEVRPLEILTGGNPRLLVIIARFGSSLSFEELMGSLLDLVDDHTEYFKSQLESLPPQERRVYLALARLWKPATARDVGDLVRLDTNVCSALLKRLVDRGAVTIEGGTPRRRLYYLTERLYNIYYLLRRGSGLSRTVQELIDFMVCLYSPSDLWDGVKQFFERDTSASVPVEITEPLAMAMLDEAAGLEETGLVSQALDAYDDVSRRLEGVGKLESQALMAWPLIRKVTLLHKLNRVNEAATVCDELAKRAKTRLYPDLDFSLMLTLAINAIVLTDKSHYQGLRAADQALAMLDRVEVPLRAAYEPQLVLVRAKALYESGSVAEAGAAIDELIKQYEFTWQHEEVIAGALSFKGSVLEQVLSEDEVSSLLSCMGQLGEVVLGSVESLMRFSSGAGPARGLALIEASSSRKLLAPLVTALQQELGQETSVAKEVEEVAEDVRRDLAGISFDILFRDTTGSPELTARKLEDQVALNQSRMDRLETAVGVVNDYLKEHLPGYQNMERQGSYALGTLIKPVDDNDEYDADIQIVMDLHPKWEPKDYVLAINRTLAGNKTYADKLSLKTRCVTVDYAGDFHLDVVPLVTVEGNHYVCNRHDNQFEETDGNGYRDWFNEKNRITGGNLKRVVRLLKYLRDHKNVFTAKSILLTTLAGNMVRESDEGTEAVNTVAGTLVTILSRLSDYLQQHPNMPEIKNPVLPTENFNRHWDQRRYANFRNRIQSYAHTAQQAKAEPSAEKAIKLWRELFGDSFG